jgi:hypothetical protein
MRSRPPAVESQRGSPGELDNRGWHIELALLERCADARGLAGVMCRLAEHVPQQAVSGLGHGTTVLFRTAGTFGGNGSGVRRQLRRGSEKVQVTSFGNNADGSHKTDPTEGLEWRIMAT